MAEENVTGAKPIAELNDLITCLGSGSGAFSRPAPVARLAHSAGVRCGIGRPRCACPGPAESPTP